jgi:hypothetical protein
LLGTTGNDLETHARAAALEDPLLKQAQIVAFHELEAAIEVRLDPAAEIFQAFGKDDARVADTPVDGHGVAILEPLDDHEQHGRLSGDAAIARGR